MIASNVLMFYLFSAVILVFSALTIFTRKILRAAVFLLFTLVATSGLYFLLNYQFMAGVQLAVYAGGIVVLIIFSILLTHQIGHKFKKQQVLGIIPAVIISAIGLITAVGTFWNYPFRANGHPAANVDMTMIGNELLGTGHNGYVLPFEVISILLLAAMVGAIVIAKKSDDKDEEKAK